MRDKEAIENERKNLLRNLEKQAKVVEKLMAAEQSMRDQLVRCSTNFLPIFQLKHF
jgi:E3 ubiquitin-protein ligase BRE1